MVFGAPLLAEEAPINAAQILREKIKTDTDKKLVVTANLDLTEPEAKKFWPIYEAYQKELKTLNQRIGQVIYDYAEAIRNGTLTDVKAETLIQESIAVEKAEAKLKSDYVPKLGRALPPRKVVRYIQMESKLRAAIRAELADRIPLVE
jgi:hypothetical protein